MSQHTPGPRKSEVCKYGEHDLCKTKTGRGVLWCCCVCHVGLAAESLANHRSRQRAASGHVNLIMLSAIKTILNVEGPAHSGSRCPAWVGIDIAYHFDKVRAAI